MSETLRISREHFGHRRGSASHTFLINSRHFLEGMRRGSWAETRVAADVPDPDRIVGDRQQRRGWVSSGFFVPSY